MATYVEITREDFEKWLDSLPHRWERKGSTAGVYWLRISPSVAVEVHSSLTGRDNSVGYADASMKMQLVSTVTNQVLNKKDQGQSHFKRTQGWRESLRKGVDRMLDAYNRSAAFYDEVATIADRQAYTQEWLTRISKIPGWEQDNLLASFHDRLKGGGLLSVKQRAIVEQSEGRKPAVDDRMLNRLRTLWRNLSGQPRAQEIAASMGQQVKAGKTLSPKQIELVEKLEQQV